MFVFFFRKVKVDSIKNQYDFSHERITLKKTEAGKMTFTEFRDGIV